MKKIICPSCDVDLTEVGVYCKTYSNFHFNERSKIFELSDKDKDGIYCSNCDSYVDVEIKE